MPELNPVIGGHSPPAERTLRVDQHVRPTLLVDPALKLHAFATAQELLAVQPLALAPGPGLRTYGDKGGRGVAEVSGASRHPQHRRELLASK